MAPTWVRSGPAATKGLHTSTAACYNSSLRWRDVQGAQAQANLTPMLPGGANAVDGCGTAANQSAHHASTGTHRALSYCTAVYCVTGCVWRQPAVESSGTAKKRSAGGEPRTHAARRTLRQPKAMAVPAGTAGWTSGRCRAPQCNQGFTHCLKWRQLAALGAEGMRCVAAARAQRVGA